jgi:hypothetical protein
MASQTSTGTDVNYNHGTYTTDGYLTYTDETTSTGTGIKYDDSSSVLVSPTYSYNYLPNKISIVLHNKNFGDLKLYIDEDDIFVDNINSTVIIFKEKEKQNNGFNVLRNLFYKIFSIEKVNIKLERAGTINEIIKQNKLSQKNKKLLVERLKTKDNSVGICFAAGNGIGFSYCDTIEFNSEQYYRGLKCCLASEENNIYVKTKENVVYVYNGTVWEKHNIEKLEISFFESKNVSEYKNRLSERRLLVEKFEKKENDNTLYWPQHTITIGEDAYTTGIGSIAIGSNATNLHTHNTGTLYYDNTDEKMYLYTDGSIWVPVCSAAT